MKEVSTVLSDCKNDLYMEGSELISATEDAMLMGTRFLLAAVGGVMSLFNGITKTTSGVAKTTAHGYHLANEYVKPVPIIGTITTGVEHALTEITDAIDDNTNTNVARRKQMINGMYTQLENARMNAAKVTVQAKSSALNAAPAKPDGDAKPDKPAA